MKIPKLVSILGLGLFMCANAYAKDTKKEDDTKCKNEEFKYRIAYSYMSKKEMGFGSLFTCFDRKIETQEDWNWLEKQLKMNQKADLTIMSAILIKN